MCNDAQCDTPTPMHTKLEEFQMRVDYCNLKVASLIMMMNV